jgi:predicted nucleotidyltransferase
MLVETTSRDPVLEKFRAAVDKLYGARIERIVLFGSRARGDARPDSDYDIAVFLRELTSRWREGLKIAEVELAILDESDAIVHTMLFPAGSWRDPASPLMAQIRNDGLDL